VNHVGVRETQHANACPLSILLAASWANQSGAVAPHSKTLREFSDAGTDALASSRANQSGAVAPHSKAALRAAAAVWWIG